MAPLRPNDRPSAHHADFLRRFTQRENERRMIKKPNPLNARQRAALREQLKDVRFLKPDYAGGTKINIALEDVLQRHRNWALDGGDPKTRSADGNGLPRPPLRETPSELLTTTTSLQWHDTVLVTKWKLRPPNIDGKPVLGTDDLLVLQTFNVAYVR
ncbi:Uncharacterized protein TCAP_02692 [Tolypocladium capitatum]|uniref:Uncharacterized protein n=1 Tax=Tolypocladium capitatum TaxID=45235 RepID=A0A2K3QIN6_9HYPO|nr:Uncharacterized protein TCAP_02692 [Tolypocladium capitatum]